MASPEVRERLRKAFPGADYRGHRVIIDPSLPPEQGLANQKVTRVLHRTQDLGEGLHHLPLGGPAYPSQDDVLAAIQALRNLELGVRQVLFARDAGVMEGPQRRPPDRFEARFERAVAPGQARGLGKPRKGRSL